MKTALILGITGNFGSQMAKELCALGWNVRALVRERAKAPNWLSPDNVWVGDANDQALIEKAAFGIDLIVYAIHPAYQDWKRQALQLLEPTAKVAEQLNLRILFPGNVYNFTPTSHLISEDIQMNAISDKGDIRIKMEQRLHQASLQGAKVTIVRAGDFIGPNTNFSWLDMILKQHKNKATMRFPHNEQHIHFWSFLPDLCANTAQLLSQPQSSYEIWHDDGLKLKQSDWKKAFLANGKTLRVSRFSWLACKLMSPFIPLVKEVLLMQYLWQQPVLLDGNKMKQALKGQYQATPLAHILALLNKH